jgi:hypothetical protein
MDYCYNVYEQRILSEIPIRGLTPLESPFSACDIRIRLGETPEQLRQTPVVKNICATMAEGEFLFFHEKLGIRFYAKDGNEIVVDRNYYSDPGKVSVYLLGSILGAVLYMRGLIPLHASAILTDKGAVLFAGASGAGKSTLAHALQQRGYPALADDVAPVRTIDAQPCLYPGYAEFKLWQESLNFTQMDGKNLPRVRDSFEKYYVDFLRKPEAKPYRICKIYHLSVHNDDQLLTLVKTGSTDRLRIVKNCVYRPSYAKGLKKEADHFLAMVGLAHLPLSTIKRPKKLSGSFEDYVSRVEADLLQ